MKKAQQNISQLSVILVLVLIFLYFSKPEPFFGRHIQSFKCYIIKSLFSKQHYIIFFDVGIPAN